MCKKSDCVSWHSLGKYLGEADEAGWCSLLILSDYKCNHSAGSLHLQWHKVSLSFKHTHVCVHRHRHILTLVSL